MLEKAPTPRNARLAIRLGAIVLTLGVVFAAPLAGALAMGVDADSVTEMKNAGATPEYGQTWVGNWMNTYGWGGFESDLRKMRDAGVTPVVMWYYYGDSISPNCVKYGCDGRTKGTWDSMAKELAKRANSIMGSREFYVVLEPEFQKNGIQNWETFDGYLENQARIVKANAPNAEVVVGFGHWGNWGIFDRAVAASDMVGFQMLYGSTRHSSSDALGAADYLIKVAKELKSRWGKPVMVYDLGIATYGGWEWVQEKSLQNVIAKRSQLDSAGVQAIIWRYVYDNDHSSGYFGPAESTWGVKYEWGGKKKGYDELVTLLKGATTSTSTSTPTSTSPSSGSTTTTSAGNVFSDVSGNAWWIEATVANSPAKVEARVNGGSWVTMSLKWWGDHAVSTHAPTGSVVELRASYSNGAVSTASYAWPSATPVSSTGTTSTTPTTSTTSGSFDADYDVEKLMEWWTQVDVTSSQSIAKVEMRVDGGTWHQLEKKSWGDYAVSVRVPYGATVQFRATSSSGATDYSGYYKR